MKTLLLIAAIMVNGLCHAQCGYGSKSQPTKVTVGMLVDLSVKQFEPSGFYGAGVHAGIWASNIGIFGGYVESKLNANTLATSSVAITLAVRKALFNDRLMIVGHFAHGTKNYQDIGLRLGYDIWNNGISVGAFASRMMHYGLSVAITMRK